MYSYFKVQTRGVINLTYHLQVGKNDMCLEWERENISQKKSQIIQHVKGVWTIMLSVEKKYWYLLETERRVKKKSLTVKHEDWFRTAPR